MEYKSAFEIQGKSEHYIEEKGEIYKAESSPWIKLSTTFREKLLRELKGSQLSVFLCLALHIDETNESYPSIETISDETGFSDRQVIRAIQLLEKRRWIEIIRETGKSNSYKLSSVVAFGKKKPQDVTRDKMSPPISRGTNDISDNEPMTMSPVTMSLKEEPEEEPIKEEPLKERHPNGRGPAIELFKRINHRNPPKKLYGTIDRVVGDDFGALLRWGRIIRKWIASGYNPTNYNGMLEVFRNGWECDKVGDSDSEKERRKYLKGWFDE